MFNNGLTDVMFGGVMGTVGVVIGSMWFGPKYGPVVRAVGFKALVLGLAVWTVMKSVM
jgi:hypothetical protein